MRSTKPSSIALSAIAVLLLGGAALLVPAQAQATGVNLFSYAAKAICESEDNGTTVETDVNVHNPRYGAPEYFFWKAYPARDLDEVVNIASSPIPYKTRIYEDGVISIDCEPFAPFEGFIVVYSTKPLDVVAVLEVEEDSEGVEDMEITYVTPQKIVLPSTTWQSWNNPAP